MVNRKIGNINVLLVMLILIMPLIAFAQDVPPKPPEQFYGTVTVNGAPAPDGLKISAKVNGVLSEGSNSICYTIDGTYGQKTAFYVYGSEGGTIEFFVNEDVKCSENAIFHSGLSTKLDLSATGVIIPTPTPTATSPTGGGGGGGGGGFVAPTPTPTPTPSPLPLPIPIKETVVTVNISDKITEKGVVLEDINITASDGIAILSIPAGRTALDADGNPLKLITVTAAHPLAGRTVIGLAYNFEPDGARFEPFVNLTLSYDPNLLPEDVEESELKIAYYDIETKVWECLDGSMVDVEGNRITAPLNHFTYFAVVVVTQPLTSTPSPTPTIAPTSTIVPTPTPTENNVSTPTPVSKPWWKTTVFWVVLIVAVVGCLVAYLFILKKKL